MTVEWDRGERLGFMPPDSAIVYPEPVTAVEWRPLTTATILDHDPEDVAATDG
jgi:hypothetical protein